MMDTSIVNLFIRSYIILVALFPVIQVGGWKPPPYQKTYPVCRTSECTKRGTYYFVNLGMAGNPCTDFYKFACGDWPLKHPRPKYALQWAVDDELNIEALGNLRDFLDNPERDGETKDEVKAKRLYHMCMSRNKIPKGDMRFVINHIIYVAERSQGNAWWDTHDQFLQLTGESALFNIAYKLGNNNVPILQFKEIGSAYGSIYHVADWKPAQDRIYAEFLGVLLQELSEIDIYPKIAKEDRNLLQKVIAFRHELNRLAKKYSAGPATAWTPSTVAQLQNWYTGITYLNENTKINWATIVRILYPNLMDDDINTKPIVALRRKEYFIGLALLLSQTSLHVLATHVQLYFMERHLIYSKDMRMKLESIFSGTKYSGRVRDDVPRWIVCLEEHSMELQLANIYMKKFFPLINEKYLLGIAQDMIDILKEDIKKSWLRSHTKKGTIKTLNALRFDFGLPSWNMHPDDKISIAEALPIKPHAFYDPVDNKMYLAAIALMSPFYEPGLPLSINIASIGSIIAHELHRILGDCGFYTVEGSSKNMVWWSAKDRKVCQTKKQCFIQEYDHYAKQDFLGLIDNTEIDSRRTFQEDFADVMGLHLAYRYYKRKSKEMPQACQILPGFEDFTCDQLFFIAYANTMCGEISPDYLSASYMSADHNPLNLRINGALRNHKAFNEIFGCRSKSLMNPSKKCNLWE